MVAQLLPWLAGGGPTGLALGAVSLVIIAMVLGWLIPLRTHREIVGLLNKANTTLEATVAEQKKQIDTLLGRSVS